MPEFYRKLIQPYQLNKGMLINFIQPYMMTCASPLIRHLFSIKSNFHAFSIGSGTHDLGEMMDCSFEDLQALSNILKDQPYFNGDSPSTVDCTIFGHLVQFVYLPLDIPQKYYIQDHCPNLYAFVDRMRDKLWPDWKEMCQESCMEGKIA